MVVGGGAISADATPELTTLVEKLGIPVVFTWNGKGAIAEDNRMCAGTAGWPGSLPGNHTAANADVVLSLGCRFTDWSASSYRKGVTFSIPGAKLIQVDIDPREIGKNYPAEVGIAADCKLVLADILAGISEEQARKARESWSSYLDHLEGFKQQWDESAGAPSRLQWDSHDHVADAARTAQGFATEWHSHCRIWTSAEHHEASVPGL